MVGTCACDCSNGGGSFSHQMPPLQEERVMCTACHAGKRAFGWKLSPEALAAHVQLCACPYQQEVSTSSGRVREMRSWMFLCLLPKHTSEVSLPLCSISKGQHGNILFCRLIAIAVQKVWSPFRTEERSSTIHWSSWRLLTPFFYSWVFRFEIHSRIVLWKLPDILQKEPNNTGLSGTC